VFETDNLQELFEFMASLDKIGVFYTVEKGIKKQQKFFRETEKVVYVISQK
jgi:hypothetical protein